MDAKQAQAEAQSAEAINAAANAAEAIEKARKAQLEAYREETTQALSAALRDVFGEHQSSGRFVDVSRIPLLCKSILNIDTSIAEIRKTIDKNREDREIREAAAEKRYVNQDQFAPVQKLVYGLVGLILSSVVVALLALVVISK